MPTRGSCASTTAAWRSRLLPMPRRRSSPTPNNGTADGEHRVGGGPLAVRPGGLVIQAFQLKYRAMPARSLALALLLLLFVMPAGVDAEPGGETVVLRLPP